jgi:splicing factor 3B subunit 3
MHLYNLTLQPPTMITRAVVGNFAGTREQQIVAARGSRLELLRVNADTGQVRIAAAQDVFGIIRSLAPFRLTGGSKGKKSKWIPLKLCLTY